VSNYDVRVGFLKEKCLNQRRQVSSDGAETTSLGSSFQIRGPETSNMRLPTVDSVKVVTTRRLVLEEHRARRPGRSATRTKGSRYHDALPCKTLYVSSAILYLIRSGTRSQRRLMRDLRSGQSVSDDRLAVPSHSTSSHRLQPMYHVGWDTDQNTCGSRVWKALT